jgi:hypothetical protein
MYDKRPGSGAAVVKLVDTLALGASAFGLGGSSPSSRTKLEDPDGSKFDKPTESKRVELDAGN